jgi:hypothetical protein
MESVCGRFVLRNFNVSILGQWCTYGLMEFVCGRFVLRNFTISILGQWCTYGLMEFVCGRLSNPKKFYYLIQRNFIVSSSTF